MLFPGNRENLAGTFDRLGGIEQANGNASNISVKRLLGLDQETVVLLIFDGHFVRST